MLEGFQDRNGMLFCTFWSNLTISARELLQTQNTVGGVASDDVEIIAPQRSAGDAHGGVACSLQDGCVAFELSPDLPIIKCDGETIARIVGHAGDIGDQLLRAPWRSRGRPRQAFTAKAGGRSTRNDRWRRSRWNDIGRWRRCRWSRSLDKSAARHGTEAVGHAVITGQPLQHAGNSQTGRQLGRQ